MSDAMPRSDRDPPSITSSIADDSIATIHEELGRLPEGCRNGSGAL